MVIRLKPLDLTRVQTSSVRRRPYRLGVEQLARMPEPNGSLHDFFASLPKIGQAAGLVEAAELMARTALAEKPMIWLIDGRLMNAGLSPLVAHMMRRGLARCLVMSGEAAVNDYELAFHGATSEDLAAGLADGLLGLARETGEGINAIINEGVKRGFSIGECLGRGILDRQPKHMTGSLLATCAARLIPATVHLSMGAEGFHRYPGADGAMLGKGSLKDSYILSSFLNMLTPGALIVDATSDRMLGQVFLHAFALARNLNDTIKGLNLISLESGGETLRDLPGLEAALHLPGAIELTLPLLLGALFSLIE
jgi:hypothetical protein